MAAVRGYGQKVDSQELIIGGNYDDGLTSLAAWG